MVPALSKAALGTYMKESHLATDHIKSLLYSILEKGAHGAASFFTNKVFDLHGLFVVSRSGAKWPKIVEKGVDKYGSHEVYPPVERD